MVDFVKLDKDDKSSEDKKPSKKRGFSFKWFIVIVIGFFFLSSILSALSFSVMPKVAVVPISGVIMTESSDSLFSGSSLSSRSIANTLREIEADSSIGAVLIDINSPGGSPVGSEEISSAIFDLREANKTVYCLVNDLAASGGFWVAVACEKIYASKMSTLGSIGVTSAGLSFENLIAEYNITYRKQTAGEFKDIGSPYRAPTEKEDEIIQNLLDEIHGEFINHIAQSRNMSVEEVTKYADGSIFLGSKALEIGFIDEIGLYDDVVEDLLNVAGNDSLVVTYGQEPSLMQVLGVNQVFQGFFPKTESSLVMLK